MKKLLASFFLIFNLHASAQNLNPTFLLTTQVDSDLADRIHVFLSSNPGPVTIEISSPGGSVMAASLIEDEIEAHGNVTCQVNNGIAASAALSIFESCQVRQMSVSGILMAHSVSFGEGGSGGNQLDTENQLASLKALNIALANHLAKHAKITAAEIYAKISTGQEWWINSGEALADGLIDSVL